MQIRSTQMLAFSDAEERGFRDRLRNMLQQDYPDDCGELGDRLDTVIDLGLARARSYGIVREKDIGLYFDVMFSLAYNFDTNPNYPWANEILNRPGLLGETKIERLARLAQQTLERETESAEEQQ